MSQLVPKIAAVSFQDRRLGQLRVLLAETTEKLYFDELSIIRHLLRTRF
ncbi:hypothetical protein RSSM_05032 [Rhodopirellula sallentina SM41]|uniref:Uncharacterized protein n=1 Tax=Rhodopirellula sallentina SM41 TaxID=1263870 RepID=M5TWH2_9BACT|nr:hypothetical protein RSSM_05032 [Rhodopirellula sallentina SM41]